MATIVKVRRLSNPRKKNKKRRVRKLSPKQIRIFGTKRQKAALKRKRTRKNPVPKVAVRPRRRANAKRRSNPALVLTLGSVNPRKRRNTPVAKAKRNRRRVAAAPNRRRRRRNPTLPARASARARARVPNRRRRRRNPTRVVVVAPRQNRHHRRHHRRRSNPALLGHPLFGKDSLALIGGGVVGVSAAKFIPTLFPASLTGGVASSNIGRTVTTGISAVLAGWLASKVSVQFGQGVLFGGMMQTLSVALNVFLPSVWGQLNPSLGDLVPGAYPVPQNPIRAGIPAPAQVRVTQSGLGRAFGAAL